MQQFAEFIANHWVLASAFAVLSFLLIGNLMGGLTARGSALSPAAVVRLINDNDAVVFDVREAAAWGRGHILAAIHVPFSQLTAKLGELAAYRDRDVVVCGDVDGITAKASAALAKAGFSKLHRLHGGIAAWQADNLPLTRE